MSESIVRIFFALLAIKIFVSPGMDFTSLKTLFKVEWILVKKSLVSLFKKFSEEETLKEIMQKSRTTSTNALAALPISNVFTSIISLHDLTKKDLAFNQRLKELLAEEAKKILPMPIEQMLFDYTIINSPEIEKAGKDEKIPNVKFFITAAANDIVKKYVEIFKLAGLNLSTVK